MKRLEKWLTALEGVMLTTATILMVTMVFIQIVCRYVLKVSLQGTEEMARFLMITGTFLGSAVAVHSRSHIQVELRHMFGISDKTREIWDLLLDVIALFALGLVGKYVYSALPDWSERSTALEIPMIFPMGAVVVGIALMMFHYLLLVYFGVQNMLGNKTEHS